MEYQVPYLTEEALEREADVLIAQFGSAQNVLLAPPIPVEDILEKHLRISLDLDDLHQKLGIPVVAGKRDILGALWVDERSVFVDRSLDPEDHPGNEGRYRFTIGHEIGHWQVHRAYLPSHADQPGLFEEPVAPTVVCRESQVREPIEWQANFFSACLLMPRSMTVSAWSAHFGDERTRVLHSSDTTQMRRFRRDLIEPFAERFVVSREAMQIRLEQLRLVRFEPSAQVRLRQAL